MTTDLPTKVQVVLWWITSIAASVLCCSVLFVYFATHLVVIRSMVKDTNDNIAVMQAREERILSEIEMIRKRAVFQPIQASANQGPADIAVEAPVSLSVSGTNPNKEPEVAPMVAPVEVSVPATPVPVPSTVVVPATTDKK